MKAVVVAIALLLAACAHPMQVCVVAGPGVLVCMTEQEYQKNFK